MERYNHSHITRTRFSFDELHGKFASSEESEVFQWVSNQSPITRDDGSIFYFAAWYGMVTVVELIIENKTNSQLGYWMAEACGSGHPDIVNALITKGATNWNRGLAGACQSGHSHIVALMVKHGANDWNLGMRMACRNGHVKIVREMISKGANDWNGGLFSACQGYSLECTLLMIEKGATDFRMLFDWHFTPDAYCLLVFRHYTQIAENTIIPLGVMCKAKIKYLVLLNQLFDPDTSRYILSFIFD